MKNKKKQDILKKREIGRDWTRLPKEGYDATAKTPDLSFGGSRKTGIRNFSTVTAEGSSLKFSNFVFFEIHPKSGIVTFGSRVGYLWNSFLKKSLSLLVKTVFSCRLLKNQPNRCLLMESKPFFKSDFFLIFCSSLLLFVVGNLGVEITKIDVRFALMVREISQYGLGVFPTINGVPYGDYPSLYMFSAWLTSGFGNCVSLLTLALPAAILGAYTIAMTYSIGESIQKNCGWYAVIFLAVTPVFLDFFCGFGIDVPAMAAFITMLYLFRKDTCGWYKLAALFVLVLLCGFLRGTLGVIVFGASVAGFLLAEHNWRRILLYGAVGVFAAVTWAGLWYALIQWQGGAELWDWFVYCQFFCRVGNENEYVMYFVDNFLSCLPISLLALGAVLLTRKQVSGYPVPELIGAILCTFIVLDIPSGKHLRYLSVIMPPVAILGAYVFQIKSEDWKLPDRILSFLKYVPFFVLGGIIAATTVLAVYIGCTFGWSLVPLGHFIFGIILSAACLMLRHPVLKKFSFALMIAVFYFYVCCPFMAVYESSEIFSKTVVKNLTGKLYFFNISPDHDELKLLLHFPAGKSRHAVYLFVKPRFPKKLYARMYPVRALDDEINSISPDDTIVLPYENDDTKHFDRLNAAVAPKGLKAVIRYTGRLGHREFASVRLIPEKNGK